MTICFVSFSPVNLSSSPGGLTDQRFSPGGSTNRCCRPLSCCAGLEILPSCIAVQRDSAAATWWQHASAVFGVYDSLCLAVLWVSQEALGLCCFWLYPGYRRAIVLSRRDNGECKYTNMIIFQCVLLLDMCSHHVECHLSIYVMSAYRNASGRGYLPVVGPISEHDERKTPIPSTTEPSKLQSSPSFPSNFDHTAPGLISRGFLLTIPAKFLHLAALLFPEFTWEYFLDISPPNFIFHLPESSTLRPSRKPPKTPTATVTLSTAFHIPPGLQPSPQTPPSRFQLCFQPLQNPSRSSFLFSSSPTVQPYTLNYSWGHEPVLGLILGHKRLAGYLLIPLYHSCNMINLFKIKDKRLQDAGSANGRPPVKKQSAGELRLHKDILHSYCKSQNFVQQFKS
ncbi:putative NEDD8-conjugating enzyme Ubc12-like [Platanthera guangdongensis]|uniref:NEDD8-conjugating enzyme Ubc12-like n=1 Tax=Platanthera guangdongensis TaxID=2320717 RepID=A0ABR2LZZ5_9ASPA